MNILEYNVDIIEKRIELGLSMLKANYEIKSVEKLDLLIHGMKFHVTRYDVKNVGNLLVMKCYGSEISEEAKTVIDNNSSMQMDSFVLTPYYKNLPMFSTDYIYIGEARRFRNEIYDLVAVQDDTYLSFIKRFKGISNDYVSLADMPTKPNWFDSLMQVYTAKMTTKDLDDSSIELFERNLKLWIEMEQKLDFLDKDAFDEKRQITKNYAKRLVTDGGTSTNVFKAELGEENTKKFFFEVFFGPDCYEYKE